MPLHEVPHYPGALDESIVVVERVVVSVLASAGHDLRPAKAPRPDRASPTSLSVHVRRPRLARTALPPLRPLGDHLGLLVVEVPST